ncbi:MAG: DUF2184 domain-containing protein [Myxacorys californica WJT36-NPBG1]|jgi:hypothetical protein|nr:DUF2184 domain-containing protein [Myxacorys californica WJT36-NPBG1]
MTTFRTDSAGAILKRWLEQKLPGVLEKRYRQLQFENGSLVPTMADLQPGAATLVQEQMEVVGEAAIVADEAFDIPLADVGAEEVQFKIIAVFSGFHFTFRQMQAAQFSNVPLSDKKAFAARRAIAEKMNKIAAFGAAKYDCTGFLNNPDVPVNNSSFNPATATADDVIEWFIDEIVAIESNTELTESPTLGLVTPELHGILLKKRVGDANLNIKSYILANTGLTDIRPVTELKSATLEANSVQAASTNKDRVMLYPLDPEIVERHIEMTKPLPEEYRNAKYITPMYACTSPVIWNFPKAARSIDYVKAS